MLDSEYAKRTQFKYIFGSIPVYEVAQPSFDIPRMIESLQDKLPIRFIEPIGLDAVVICETPEFEKREIDAFVQDSTIYIRASQRDENSVVYDIIHEVAHIIEEKRYEEIYGDGELVAEFLEKRRLLYHKLDEHGHAPELERFEEIDYTQALDNYLNHSVGYEELAWISMHIFIVPYSATSIREYFASGFEFFYAQDDLKNELRKMSPVLYQRIQILHED